MTFWVLLLVASLPLHPASLLIRVPAAKSSLPVLSAFALRPGLTFRYGWRHRPRRAPFIPIVHQTCQAHDRASARRSSKERALAVV